MVKVNFGDVKSALAACHVKTSDTRAKFMLDIDDVSYFNNRVIECLNDIQNGGDEEASLILAIQLLGVRYAKLLKTRKLGDTSTEPRVKKSRQPKLKIASTGDSNEPVSIEGEPKLGTRSEDPAGDHQSPAST